MLSILIASLTGIFFFLSVGCSQQVSPIQYRIPDDWKNFETRYFSFFGPPEMSIKNAHGIDSEGWLYRTGNMTLDIESGIYSNDLQMYRDQPDYREELVEIGGRKAKLCFFRLSDAFTNPQNQDRRFIAAVHFSNAGDGSQKLTFWAGCREVNEQEIARIIFQSIRFH